MKNFSFSFLILLATLMLSGCTASPDFPHATPAQAATLTRYQQLEESTARFPAPDGQWEAIIDRGSGRLVVGDPQGIEHTIFPMGSGAIDASWALDASRLAVALSGGTDDAQAPESFSNSAIWLIEIVDGELSEPRLIHSSEPSAGDTGPFITLGAWSPGGGHLLFWVGPLSASIQADGLPLWSLEVETGKTTRLAETTLLNPTYRSWAPDGSALAFTNGGYRSAQVGKWLSIYEVASRRVKTVIPEDELIPGQVAWSPAGDTIAFAATEADQTGDEWADWMDWENPAILARRIFLLDPQTDAYWRLNAVEAYQDAPRWGVGGDTLYYIQMDGDQAILMLAEPASEEAQSPSDCKVPLPSAAGYYGQVDWSGLYQECPATEESSPPPSQ